ncbi:MAG: hypothetical protein ACI97A_001721 [Planctomycetota bacterium]
MSSQETDGEVVSGNRLWRLLYLKLIKPVLTVKDTPHALALGISVGLWVSLTPTVGIQMTIVFVIGTLIKANRIAGVAMTWISNPATFLPMYYGYYRIGILMTGEDPISFAALKSDVAEYAGWDLVVYFFEFVGKPMWLGSILVATVISVPAYPLCRRFFENREKKRLSLLQVQAPVDRPNNKAGIN